MSLSVQTYALSKKYTDDTAIQFGGLKGAPCQVKSIEKKDGQNIVTFEWKNDAGDTRESKLYVYDGTPIYEWQSGDTYHYGDLVIYASAFYRCIRENADVTFDDTKWNEIGSPDGNYDIVQNTSLLPPRFTSADRKMYYSIEDGWFYLWDGNSWIPQRTVNQYIVMPTPASVFENRVVQFIGATGSYTQGFFYKCVSDGAGGHIWEEIATQKIEELTSAQISNLITLL